MKKMIFVFAIASSFAMASAASAGECPLAKKHHVVHRHVAPSPCAKAAPKVVVKKPVEHVTKVIEKTVIEHVVVEMPTRVIAPRLTCCPPGVNRPDLQPCRTLGSGAPQGRPTLSKWAQVSACMKGLGLNDDEFFSRRGFDGTDHVRLTGEAAARMRAAGMLQAVDECAARLKSSNIAYQ